MRLTNAFASAAAVLSLLSLVSLAACGGSVVTLGPGDGGGGDGSPNPFCPAPSVVGNGVACNDPGLSCPGPYGQPTCSGPEIPVQCTCSGGTWQCPVLAGGIACPPPPSTCPTPSAVIDGVACSTDPSLSCESTIAIQNCPGQPTTFEYCSCISNGWACPAIGAPICPVDAGAPCPDPNHTFAGAGCATYGRTCGGDPQSCGSQIVYDALQCVAGVWNVVASTACDLDGGTTVDAQGPDGGL